MHFICSIIVSKFMYWDTFLWFCMCFKHGVPWWLASWFHISDYQNALAINSPKLLNPQHTGLRNSHLWLMSFSAFPGSLIRAVATFSVWSYLFSTCIAASPAQLPELLAEVLKCVQYGISGGPAVTVFRVLFTFLNYHHTLVWMEISK